MMSGKPKSESSIYYGWYVAVCVGVTAFIAWGAGFYQLGVFIQALREQHGWSLAALSVGPALFYVLVGIGNLLCGRIIDRYGPRRVLLGGTLLLAAGLVALGRAGAVWQFYAASALLAIGFAGTSTLVLGAIVGRWFRRRRAFVMSMALCGAPLGALVLVPASTALLNRYGLASGAVLLALLALALVLPLATLVVRDQPADLGLQVDGQAARPEASASRTDDAVWTLRAAAATPVWWLLTASFALIMLGQVAYLVHQMAFYSPLVGSGQASALVSLTGAFGIIGRFVGGLGDRLPKHALMAGCCFLQGAGVLLAATTHEPAALALSAALVGFTMGNTVALQPVLMAERFGMRSYGTVFGPASLLTQFGAALGLTLVGTLADVTGGYVVPLALTGSLAVLAGLSALAAGSAPVASPARRASAA